MKMAKLNLAARLARSLESANKIEAASTPKPATNHKTPRASKTTGCSKLSISLFASDLQRLEAILSFMAARGHRLSTSQAVKLALRTAPLSEALTAALERLRSEDGRRK